MTDASVAADTRPAEHRHGVSLAEAFRVWLRVAALSFGGPAGQIERIRFSTLSGASELPPGNGGNGSEPCRLAWP